MLEDLREVVRLRAAAEYEKVYGTDEGWDEADQRYKKACSVFFGTHAAQIEQDARDAERYRWQPSTPPWRRSPAMADKLSDRLWAILNNAALGDALSVPQLCAIVEARELTKRVEDAPVGVVKERGGSLSFIVVGECLDAPSVGKRVRLVLEGE